MHTFIHRVRFPGMRFSNIRNNDSFTGFNRNGRKHAGFKRVLQKVNIGVEVDIDFWTSLEGS